MPSTSTIDGNSALLRLIVISLFNNCIARVDILRGVGLGNFSEQYFLRPDLSLARKFFSVCSLYFFCMACYARFFVAISSFSCVGIFC